MFYLQNIFDNFHNQIIKYNLVQLVIEKTYKGCNKSRDIEMTNHNSVNNPKLKLNMELKCTFIPLYLVLLCTNKAFSQTTTSFSCLVHVTIIKLVMCAFLDIFH